MRLIYFILFLCAILSCTNNSDNTRTPKKISDQELLEMNKYLVNKDKELIKAYIKRRNWVMKPTGSGLWYMIYNKVEGKETEKGQIAEINYRIELLDGTLCYSSDSLGIAKLQIGKGKKESGLDEGLLLMKEGEKAWFIMPPHLAHHLLGDENKIPARATIVYHVELLKITDN